MKTKYILLILILLTSSYLSIAATKTWTGSISNSYSNSGNWSPSGVPIDSVDNIVINSNAPNNLILTQNRVVSDFTINGDTIDLGGYQLTITGTAKFDGGLVTNGIVLPTGNLCQFSASILNVNVSATCGYFRMNGGTFNYPVSLSSTGAASTSGTGGCVFNDSLSITNTGTYYFTMGSSGKDYFNNTVTITNLSTHEVYLATGDSAFFNNIIVNSTNGGGMVFGNSGGVSTLASGKTISVGTGGFTNDYLTLKNFIQLGSTAQTLTLTGTAIVNLINCTFNGDLTVTAPGFLLKTSTFNGTSNFTRNASSTNHQSDGGNIFNGSTTIDNAGIGGRIRMATTTGDTFNGNVTFNSSGGQDVQVGYAGNSYLYGNITINSNKVVFNTASGKVTFAGGNSQSLNGSYNFPFKKLAIDKSANQVTANSTLSVDDTLFFIGGNLITTSSNLITMKGSSVASGASNSSFVSGPVKKVGNTAFEFPVGKDSFQNSIEISAPSTASDAFTAEYFDEEQSQGNTMDTSIDYISLCDYWKLDRTAGSSNVNVYLSWNSNDCPILDSIDLRVAVWNGSQWKDLGQNSFTGNVSSGKIKNNTTISNYSYFTFAYRTTTLPYVVLGNDTTIVLGTFNISGVSAYGVLRWFPKADLSCYTCLNPVVTFNGSRKYFLFASDYKNRFAVDSITLKLTASSQSLPTLYYPPAVDWKADDWIKENVLDNDNPLNWDDSGDEWWYGHSNSLDGSTVDGYICAGYASFINMSVDESTLSTPGCGDTENDPSFWDCEDFESSTLKKGRLFATVALKPLSGKNFMWYRVCSGGQFYMAKSTSDGGYLAVGHTYATRDRETGDIIGYNPTSLSQTDDVCDFLTTAGTKGYIVKTNKSGEIIWQYRYGPESINNINDQKAEIFNFVEMDGGFRAIGLAWNPSSQAFNSWILDIDENGYFLNSYFIPETSTNQPVTGIEQQYYGIGSDIIRYELSGTEYNIICGYTQGPDYLNPLFPYPSRIAYIAMFNEGTLGALDLLNDLAWVNEEDFNHNSNELNSTAYYVKMGKNEFGDDIILFPVVDNCGSCYGAGDNMAEGLVYKVDITTGDPIGNAVSIGSIHAYDLKIDVVPTEDFGFAVLSTKEGVDKNQGVYSCTPSDPSDPTVYSKKDYWNSDAYVAKFSSVDVPEWEIKFDINDKAPVAYPKNYKKQECLYTITQAPDNGYVIAGNNSENFDDFYLCKLQSDCITRIVSDADISGFNNEYIISPGGSPETWSSSKTVFGKVVIQANAKLIIEGSSTVITFADSRRIADETGHNILTQLIVEPGGELEIMDHAVLDVIDSGCDDGMWDGIQVLGQPNLSQTVANQGYVKIHETAQIRNARIAICADEAKYDRKFEYLTGTNLLGGGIVQATDGSIFENNRDGIWIGPFRQGYSVNRIIGNDFISSSILRDPFYKYADDRREALSSFVKLYGSSQFNISVNNFTALNTQDADIRGNGIECHTCGINITSGNTFTDLTYGIYADNLTLGSTRRILISENIFNDVYFGANIIGGSFAEIKGNVFNIPTQVSGLERPYGVWMNFSRDYRIYNRNEFLLSGTAGLQNIGLLATRSAPSACEIFDNAFDGTFIGTQTESYNTNLQIRCNTYENHAHSWVVNPQSAWGILNDQGTGCPPIDPTFRTAGNLFIDACFDPVKKNHISSTVDFWYYANGYPSQTLPYIACSSDILSDANPGDIEDCGNGSLDPLACAVDEPSGNDRDEWLDIIAVQEDRGIKAKLWTSFIQLLISEDTLFQDSTIVMYFDSLDNSETPWYKITWYLDKGDSLMVDSLISTAILSDAEDSLKFDYYELLRSKMNAEGTFFNLSSSDIENIEPWLANNSDITNNAFAWLGTATHSTHQFIPEQLSEERIGKSTVLQKDASIDQLKIFPNPSSGIFTVTTNLNLTENTICEIINSYGELVFTQANISKTKFEINISNLPAGIYLLFVKSSNSTLSTKFIVQQ